MPYCRYCGSPYEGAPRFCRACGRPLVYAPPRRRDLKWLWIGLSALIVVVAVVLVLTLAVFGGDGNLATPEKAVAQLLGALEKKDFEAVLKLIDPRVAGVFSDKSQADVFQVTLEELLPYKDMKFKDIVTSTKMTSEKTATVTIVAGSVTITGLDGSIQTENVAEAEGPMSFDLVKVDGKWYLSSIPFTE